MRTSIETITPLIAKALLQNNQGNRHLRKSYVDLMAGALKRGEWVLTHQGLALGEDGVVLDGQHRLAAIALSGIPAIMNVSRDVPASAFQAIDTGLTRSAADVLGIPRHFAETAMFLARVYNAQSVTKTQVGGMYYIYQDQLAQLWGASTKKIRVFSSAPMKAVGAVALKDNPANRAYIENMYRRLTHHDTENDAPKIVHTLLKVAATGRFVATGASRSPLIYAATLAFNPAFCDLAQFKMYDGTGEKALADLRKRIEKHQPKKQPGGTA